MQKPNLRSDFLFILFWVFSFLLSESIIIFLEAQPNFHRTILKLSFFPRNLLLNIDMLTLAGLQWALLRKRIRLSGLWGLVTLVGGLMGGFLSTAFVFAVRFHPPSFFPTGVIGDILTLAITWGILGFVIGLFQCGVLWFQVKGAGWWILATAAAYSLISPIHISVGALTGYFAPFLSNGIFKDLIGLIPLTFSAFLMGAALLWMLEHRKQKNEEQPERQKLEQIP